MRINTLDKLHDKSPIEEDLGDNKFGVNGFIRNLVIYNFFPKVLLMKIRSHEVKLIWLFQRPALRGDFLIHKNKFNSILYILTKRPLLLAKIHGCGLNFRKLSTAAGPTEAKE